MKIQFIVLFAILEDNLFLSVVISWVSRACAEKERERGKEEDEEEEEEEDEEEEAKPLLQNRSIFTWCVTTRYPLFLKFYAHKGPKF